MFHLPTLCRHDATCGPSLAELDEPSEGNDVRLAIQSATFGPDNINGVAIQGSSINDPDPVAVDFSANGDGDTVTVTLTQADITGSSAGV